MRYALHLAAVVWVATNVVGASAQAQTPAAINLFYRAEDACRGTPGGDSQSYDCGRRDGISDALKAMGYCLGLPGQFAYQYRWHRCGPADR